MIVEYRTPWTRQTGWCIAARGYARAMELAGIRVHLTSWMQAEQPEVLQYRPPDPAVAAEVAHMLVPPGRDPDVSVLSSTLAAKGTIAFANWPKQPGKSVVYTTFEREQISQELVDQLNKQAGVWVPCTWNADTLIDCGVSSLIVRVFPHVYFDDDPLLALGPPETRRSFLWIGQWEPRKAPHNLIRAFLNAFHWREGARLVLKTSGKWTLGDYPEPEVVIDREACVAGWRLKDAFDAITVVRNVLSRDEIVKLYRNANVYVSASRGEGFDLPSFQAKLAGRRVVTTDSGGPRDFLDKNDELVPATQRVHIDPAYNYGDGSLHADYEVGALSEAMRAIADLEPAPRPIVKLAQFNAEMVGCQLSEWFASL